MENHKINIIQPNWPVHSDLVTVATTCRPHGFSQAPFDSLNLAHYVDDHPPHVNQNWQKTIAALGCPSQPILLKQTHSNHVVKADDYQEGTEADASFTQTPNLVLSILTADCLPIVLFQPKPHALAVVHAGWRGMANGILQNTIQAMPGPPEQIIAWLGPCIGEEAFEIGDACIKAWKESPIDLTPALVQYQAGIHGNLVDAATLILQHFGIHDIYPSEYCTHQMAYSFFSHRRDQGKTGRMATLAWLNPMHRML